MRHPAVPCTLHQRKPGERGYEGSGDVAKLQPLLDIADDEVGDVEHHCRQYQGCWGLGGIAGQASNVVDEAHLVKCLCSVAWLGQGKLAITPGKGVTSGGREGSEGSLSLEDMEGKIGHG